LTLFQITGQISLLRQGLPLRWPGGGEVKRAGTGREATVPWRIHFFQRHPDDDESRAVPAREFLSRCPAPVRAKLIAVVKAVAEAPPPAFSGGGKWEAMHDDMNGFYEVRVDGSRRRHYRLFCLLDREGARVGLGGPSLVLITGMEKPFRTTFKRTDYAGVRRLGKEFLVRSPRSVAS
jgi:hypothetical protein